MKPEDLALYEAHMKEARAGWPDGPWNHEPDRVQWRSEAGLPCLIVRSHVGALCGYVGVSQGHPAFDKDRDDLDVDVHGGLTYSDKCSGPICHVPEEGESDEVFWIGFDCNHAFDLSPSMLVLNAKMRELHPGDPLWDDDRKDGAFEDIYRDVAYVRSECESLARQLAAMGSSK